MMEWDIFLHPAVLSDTPRLFTAIAEFLAVLVYFNIYKRKHHDRIYFLECVGIFIIQVLYQLMAGFLPLSLWVPAMIGAVGLMYAALFYVLDIKPKDCAVVTTHAFVLAEFAASLYRQMYVWATWYLERESFLLSCIMMSLIYAIVYGIFFKFQRSNISPDRNLNITTKELLGVVVTGITAFVMANISFVNSKTPFSATENLLYVRTLVDFGGLLMLMTEMGRRNELALRSESSAINSLLQKQYEQYKLAIDNSEALRKEMHDMKHYVLALKNEDDPEKRAEVLADMEQAIAIQESFMNTGNKVLDVILTTKSLQCQRNGITLNAMVDGTLLSAVHVKDICSLFGNMLDNAIEACQQVHDPERRLITLTVRRRNQFTIVECENYGESSNVKLRRIPVRRRLLRKDLPATTKGDNVKHGFGLKSIAQVAEKYDGALRVSYDDGWFKVKVLLSSNLS